MGRRRRKKPRHGSRGIRVTLDQLEIARGHDGLLRGSPEPAWIFALFRFRDDKLSLLARNHFETRLLDGSFPCSIQLEEVVLELELVSATEDRFLLLALAIERDSGDFLQTMYARVEQSGRFHVWDASHATPTPLTLAEIATGAVDESPDATRLRLLWDGTDIDSEGAAAGDDWVGAAAVVFPGASRHNKRTHRVHVVSPDEQNDWTAELEIRFV